MLRDSPIKKVPGDKPRKWMIDDKLELIVWYWDEKQEKERIFGFQLVYDRMKNEHAVTWNLQHGFLHHSVDQGEDKPGRDRTPMLIPNGPLPKNRLITSFFKRSKEIPQDIRNLVLEKLNEFPAHLDQ